MNFERKRIGIIGGAGPMAGALLFEKIIESSQKYGCKVDADFPFCFLINYPFAPMLINQFDQQLLKNQLEFCFACLEKNQISIAAVACNTLHIFLPSLPEGMQFVHMIEETKFYVQKKGWVNPLVLCTSTSAKTQLHAQYFPCRYPDATLQNTVDILIDRITEGCDWQEASNLLSEICKNEGPVILGCTELSLLHNRASLFIKDLCSPDTLVSEKIAQIFFEEARSEK
jgi:aspartate racemase